MKTIDKIDWEISCIDNKIRDRKLLLAKAKEEGNDAKMP